MPQKVNKKNKINEKLEVLPSTQNITTAFIPKAGFI
jgi:hypothetical protein